MKIMTDAGEVPFAYADGYSIAERLLEGVRFRIEIVNDKPVCTGFHPEDEKYMSDFSDKRIKAWKKQIVDSSILDGLDINGTDAWVEGLPEEESAATVTPVRLHALSGDEVFNMLFAKK